MAGQLRFDWPSGVSLSASDFFVSPSNALAHETVLHPDDWPDGKLVLRGPADSGKSHLARMFADRFDARVYQASALGPATPGADCIVVEDMDHLPRSTEEALFHLHNNHLAQGGRLLMTARAAPTRWDITLPDLASRMQATHIATIGPPDEALLGALIVKQFSDRQINIPADCVDYIVKRVERSFDAVTTIVQRIDETTMNQTRAITRPLVAEVLDKLSSE